MADSFILVAKQVGVLFALMFAGFACRKVRLLTDEAVRGVLDLLVFVVTPCLIVHVFQRDFDAAALSGLGVACAAAVAIHLAGIAVSLAIFRNPGNRGRECVLRFATVFSNAGFMGLPLEYALLGPDGVFYGCVYVVVFNVFCWSWGLVQYSGGLKEVRARTLFVNPGTVGIALGMPLFLFSVRLPEAIGEPVHLIAEMNTPLAMIAIGYYLAGAKLGPVMKSGTVHLVSVLRLAVFPAAALGGMWLVHPDNSVMSVATVTAASAPVAGLTAILAAKYGRDVDMAVGLVSWTTLLSILTMPPLVGLAMWLFGVGRFC